MMQATGSRLALAIAALAATPLSWAQAGAVQGAVSVGGAKIVLSTGMAVGYRGPDGPLVSVLLADKPADAQEFATDTKIGAGERLVPAIFEGAWKSQHIGKKFSGFTFTVAGPSTVFTEEFLVGGRNNTFSLDAGSYVLELKSTSPRLVGRIRTKMPIVEAGSIKAGIDASFDLPVTPRQ